MKKFLILLAPLLIGVSSAWGEILIQNDQQYLGTDGSLHIVGEVYNGFQVPLNQIDVQATLFSNDGTVIDIVSTNSLVSTIMPSMKAPFDFVILGEKAKSVENYNLIVDYEFSSPKGQVIDITSSEISQDNFNNLVVTGKVANKGEITANTVAVVATFYDRQGNVAAVSKMNPEPDYLRSDDEAFFFVTIDKTLKDDVVDYSLIAESEEYAAVPEFPLGSMILLASSVSAYVVLTRYSSRFTANLVAASNLK